MASKWKFVGYSLQLNYDVIEKIEERNHSIEDLTFAMLVQWMQTDPEPCYCKLISALSEQGLMNAIESLKGNLQYVPSSHCRHFCCLF